MIPKQREETFRKYLDVVESVDPIKYLGKVDRVNGLTIESVGPVTQIGDICQIRLGRRQNLLAEVVGLHQRRVILMPYGSTQGVFPGAEVVSTSEPLRIHVGESLMGRILDGLGKPLDGQPEPYGEAYVSIENEAPNPIRRHRITQPLSTGVRAIDSLLTVGQGQRMGIFAGTGVGKSTLLGMIARHVKSDVNVIALIGERGREVREFIEKDLGEGLKNSVVIAATADMPPLVRIKGAFVATAIAEYFRDQGKNVVLMMDSITRLARAQREVGLATGEAPATRGFPPSVFKMIPELVERTGPGVQGSITAFYNVLVEADDFNEPISDTVRGHLDGHIELTRQLANRGIYPAIDVTSSISRLMTDLIQEPQLSMARQLKEMVATYRENEDLIKIGAYVRQSDPRVDAAIDMNQPIEKFMQQTLTEQSSLEQAGNELFSLFGRNDYDPKAIMPNYYVEQKHSPMFSREAAIAREAEMEMRADS